MDFSLPPVGEGLLEVELVRWQVRPGDAVVPGQVLAEVMSDKANMEVPAPFSGTITELFATPGTKVRVGQRILSYQPVATGAEKPPAPDETARTAATTTTAATSTPSSSERFPVAAPAAATAATATLPAPSRGGTSSNGHPPLAGSGPPATASPGVSPAASAASSATVSAPRTPLPPAAPSVRALARKLGVDLSRIRGSGPHGRILLDDLTPFLVPKATPAAAQTPAAHGTDTSRLDFGIAGTRMKLIGLRRKIAEHMVESKRHIPHYSYIDECDLSDIVRLRNQLREPLAQVGVKLTYLAFFVKAVARALQEVPIVNSTFDESAGEVILHDKYNIGIAVAAPQGLMVPVVKDANKKDLVTIAADIERLSNDAKNGKSKIDDLRGGTFTVTSVGGIGGLISTPIINHPEVGIMGVGKVVKRPMYDAQGNLKPTDIVYLSFSFDHRVVDGAIGAAFGNVVMRYLQAPALLLLPEKTGV
jgi:pyruvate dehydrogenase E2 component (dihydrolipoamide acetyltransferase)/2-oxoisovalerate dehydrogenase E2 component (dihydrolipoyl transacylase)